MTAPVINPGIVNATNGNLNLVGAASGAGAYRAVAGASAATLTFAGGGSISALFNTGATIQVESTLTNNSLFVNQGTIVLNASTYQSSANFTNALNEFVIASDDSTLSAASVVNRGTILTTNATLLVSNLVVQSGTITIGNSGTLMLVGAGALTNFGTINLVGTSGNNAVLNLGSRRIDQSLPGGTITGPAASSRTLPKSSTSAEAFSPPVRWSNCSSPTPTPLAMRARSAQARGRH